MMVRQAFILLLFISPALSQSAKPPGYGSFFNTTSNHGIWFDCQKKDYDEISCEFKEIAVFKQAKDGELPKKIEEARSQFRATPNSKMDCTEMERALAIMKGAPAEPERIEAVKRMSPREKADIERSVTAALAFCKNPTEEGLVNLTKLNFERENKTCRIFTTVTTQAFKRVSNDAWTSNEGPGGLCGVISIGRLDRVKAGTNSFWVYTSKRIVNNKRAPSAPEMCKSMDETEQFFDWKNPTRFVGCDYIEYGF